MPYKRGEQKKVINQAISRMTSAQKICLFDSVRAAPEDILQPKGQFLMDRFERKLKIARSRDQKKIDYKKTLFSRTMKYESAFPRPSDYEDIYVDFPQQEEDPVFVATLALYPDSYDW